MMNQFLIVLLILFWGCSTPQPESHPSGLMITEINPDKATALTKQNLLQLSQVYDLSPFYFTKKIHIQSKVVSHSHPVLVLNTKNAEFPKKLLSAFIHEEIHWWLTENKNRSTPAIKDLQKIYPKVPVTKGQNARSTYLHLIVCYIELKALSSYLGKEEGRKIITSIMKKDKFYPWVYYQVLYKDFAINKIVAKYKLVPPGI